jgi:hypothetical protein
MKYFKGTLHARSVLTVEKLQPQNLPRAGPLNIYQVWRALSFFFILLLSRMFRFQRYAI